MTNQQPKYKPYRRGATTTIYPRYEIAVAQQGTIYRLDTYTAKHDEKINIGGNYQCVYIKAMFRNMLVKTYNPVTPMKRNLIQKLKFWLKGPAKV